MGLSLPKKSPARIRPRIWWGGRLSLPKKPPGRNYMPSPKPLLRSGSREEAALSKLHKNDNTCHGSRLGSGMDAVAKAYTMNKKKQLLVELGDNEDQRKTLQIKKAI
ncbi:hypothetical protein U1Q18_029875 [Sarracenia purpurea var. burkii]